MIRLATPDNTMDIYFFLRPFFDEGHWCQYGQFSPENSVAFISNYLTNAHTLLSVGSDGSPNGLLVVEISYEFHTKPVAYVSNFYVSPDARGTGVARELFDAAIKHCKDVDCVAIYAANCGIFEERPDRLFGNLIAKFGFRKLSSLYGRF